MNIKTAAIILAIEIFKRNMTGFMYILECKDGSLYIGSTKNLDHRIIQHQMGIGANFTKKNLPVKLVYYEEFRSIDFAFLREKQIQGWSRSKKLALIKNDINLLKKLSKAKNSDN